FPSLFWSSLLAFQRRFLHEKPGMAEGVGFEPTVGFPTLDFESSALNPTQTPFLYAQEKRRFPHEKPGRAEGLGFDPTVVFPPLDFESSPLTRTQPPFLYAEKKRRTR